MGLGSFIKKAFKPISRFVRSVGRRIRKAAKSFGKFMGKIGVFGQLAMSFLLPGVGGMFAKMAQGMINYTGVASGIINGAGKFLNVAANVGRNLKSAVGNITKGVTGAIKNTLGAVGDKLGIGKLIGKDLSSYSFSNAGKSLQTMFTDVKGDLFGPKGLFSKNTLTSTIESRAFDAQLEEGIGRAIDSPFKPVDETTKLGSEISGQVQDITSKIDSLDSLPVKQQTGMFSDTMYQRPSEGAGLFGKAPTVNVEAAEEFINSYDVPQGFDLSDPKKFEVDFKRAEDFLGDQMGGKTTTPSLLQQDTKSFSSSVKDHVSKSFKEITDAVNDPDKFVSFLKTKGGEFGTTYATNLASNLADKQVFGTPQAPTYNVSQFQYDATQPSVGSLYDDTLFSAMQYKNNMANGNYYGNTAAWWDWQRFSSEARK